MKNKVLLVILVMSLVCAWGGAGTAGQIGYSMRGAEEGIRLQTQPQSSQFRGDGRRCLIGRPLGLATTIAGTALLVVETPVYPLFRVHR